MMLPSAEFCEILRQVSAAQIGPLSDAIDRLFAGSATDVTAHTRPTWVSVSEEGLPAFEFDSEFKSYKDSNHIFADFLGGVTLPRPFVVHLSWANAPGARVTLIPERDIPIIALGKPYSLADVVGAISYVLQQQNVTVVSPWFRGKLRTYGIDPDDPSFKNIVALPVDFARWLQQNRSQLGKRTILVKEDRVDAEAIADELQIAPEGRAIIARYSPDELRCDVGVDSKREIVPVSRVSTFLRAGSLRNIAVVVSAHDEEFWSKLPPNAFENIDTVLVAADPEAVSWLPRLSPFSEFNCLRRVPN
ncbi:hypothetical protein HZZ13_05580 [Bradyrhizobium sp. CNPSo 4010]|uniref:Uncharacterized protein n=1 Tax=Bradyrhizobium agreste TaxID=2751811 RepID=A0ABS0PK89_9BRAD|nr:hypothetical protein [Bradyrhizobium agreste]MBH5397264.1 hypothetical protein [Bradyrhizobium agreste]